MKKIALAATLLLTLSYGKIIDGIAVIVNDEPITLYEINKVINTTGLSRREAIQLLIREKLENEQIKKLGVTVDDIELDQALEKIAKQKGTDLFGLQEAIISQGGDWEKFKEGLRKQLLRKKLYAALTRQQTQKLSEKDLKEYYETHKNEFEIAKEADIVKYISPSKEVLAKIAQNPLYQPSNNALLQKGEEKIDLQKVNPQFAYLLNQTPEGSFTKILPMGDKYLLIYIKHKYGKEYIPFEEAKGYILNRLSKTSGVKNVKEYFDKLKASANIKVIRLP
ncbi:peptidyl-prolyl cis-trans isomerase [Nitratiruptor sp. SB155-2]|uniref:peptidyl-prolyl cis-trans isomerase n=1 Tax=Nitratiruptor sp. (strain SB155-2) TaxID=387092 RepID=UPI0001587374|nr:hypothetical protein [Nitratiruptor sp. SB155-2]BAF70748.1 conserved hypothetical protein [Nitratiruptor sp. SB155-2]